MASCTHEMRTTINNILNLNNIPNQVWFNQLRIVSRWVGFITMITQKDTENYVQVKVQEEETTINKAETSKDQTESNNKQTYTYAGSAFLITPDIIMTNCHVALAIDPFAKIVGFSGTQIRYNTNEVRAIFNSLRSLSDNDIPAEPNYTNDSLSACSFAANNPLLAYSYHYCMENYRTKKVTNLDYALIRLGQPIGREIINDSYRGWFNLLETQRCNQGDPLCNLYKPSEQALPLLNAGQNAIETVFDDNSGITDSLHSVNGSSGSPCFDLQFRLKALRKGARDSESRRTAVPIDEILRHVQNNFPEVYKELLAQTQPSTYNPSTATT